MLVVHTELPLAERERERAEGLIDDLAATADTEHGTIVYRVSRAENGSLVRFFEAYEDRAAHEAHTASEAYRAFVRALPEIAAGEIETIQCETDDLRRVSFTGREAAESVE